MKTGHITSSGTQRLLVIRLSAMGDVAMTVPVLIALTQKYPELRITFLTKPFFSTIIEQIPTVAVYKVDVKGKHEGILGLWRLYKELKSLNIEAVADLHDVLRSNILKHFFKLGGIPFFQIDKGRAEKKVLTAEKNKKFKPLKTTHQRYADVFGQLGLPIHLKKENVLGKQSLSKKTQDLIGQNETKLIGIAPFAAFNGKMYPEHLMEQVIWTLNKTDKYKILFFGGGKTEQAKLNMWEKQFSRTVNIAGKLYFSEELSLISNLDLMLAMDSGNSHLAAMYGVPTVTLWGVTHPYAGFYPYGQDENNALLADREQFPLIPTAVYGNKFPKGYEKAMETITPEQVVEKVMDLLSK